MPKVCSAEGCKYNVFSKGYCKMHQRLRTDKRPKPISPFSQKHLENLKEYRIVRDEYMRNHPRCECNGRIDGCHSLSEDLHHAKGRGKYLCDTKYFRALSRHCHNWVGENPLKAIEMGLLFNTGDI